MSSFPRRRESRWERNICHWRYVFIDELNEEDNTASKNLSSATLPDLSITSADIEIFPPAPDPYIMVGIFIKVRNHGETDASNVLVEVYTET